MASVGLAALTIALFLLNLHRIGERAARAAERLDNLERTNAMQRRKPSSRSGRSA